MGPMFRDFLWKSNPLEQHITICLDMWVPPPQHLTLAWNRMNWWSGSWPMCVKLSSNWKDTEFCRSVNLWELLGWRKKYRPIIWALQLFWILTCKGKKKLNRKKRGGEENGLGHVHILFCRAKSKKKNLSTKWSRRTFSHFMRCIKSTFTPSVKTSDKPCIVHLRHSLYLSGVTIVWVICKSGILSRTERNLLMTHWQVWVDVQEFFCFGSRGCTSFKINKLSTEDCLQMQS